MTFHLSFRSSKPEKQTEKDGKAQAAGASGTWPGLSDSPVLCHQDD